MRDLLGASSSMSADFDRDGDTDAVPITKERRQLFYLKIMEPMVLILMSYMLPRIAIQVMEWSMILLKMVTLPLQWPWKA